MYQKDQHVSVPILGEGLMRDERRPYETDGNSQGLQPITTSTQGKRKNLGTQCCGLMG